jgi:hypothetical protein
VMTPAPRPPLINDTYRIRVIDHGGWFMRWEIELSHGPGSASRFYTSRKRGIRSATREVNRRQKVNPVVQEIEL